MTSIAPHMSVEAARRKLAREFRSHGLDTPELDARLLVGYALGLDHGALIAQARCLLASDQAQAVSTLAARRLAREPLARIVGYKEFWGLPLTVNAGSLVPRPETETVVEAALAAIERPKASEWRIGDLGTGSGALLLALLAELPGANGIGTDISPAALACASANAVRLGLSGRVLFAACDYGSALRGPFDILVSNPPYIARCDIAGLPPEVRDHDPPRALDGGFDGLDGYRAIAGDARRLLTPEGVLVVELGLGQVAAVTAAFRGRGACAGCPQT